MIDLLGDPVEKKPKKPPKEPFDLDAKLEEIKNRPKAEAKMKVYIPPVEWFGKFYEDVSRAGMEQAVLDHIHYELTPDQARAYRKYLVNSLNFPRSWLGVEDEL